MKKCTNSSVFILFLLLFLVVSCSKSDEQNTIQPVVDDFYIKGCDISFLPQIRLQNVPFYNENNQVEDMLQTLKRKGVNTIRLRLWKNTTVYASQFNTVRDLTQECKNLGFKVLLCVHYSDTWADPGTQNTPQDWQGVSFAELNTKIRLYTKDIIEQINPDYIQIGNEINNGFLWPQGHINQLQNFKTLVQTAATTVRETNPSTKIILHFAGHENAMNFFNHFTAIDYDYIGISYYPQWHGKNLTTLKNNLQNLPASFSKKVFIAETSYPFTLGWNDQTNNVIGFQEQVLPTILATPQGQKQFLQQIKSITQQIPNCNGFCYWGAEWTSFNGPNAQNEWGSPWENQALWDFNNKAQPALDVFQ